jgi:hypothetical protein
MGAYRMVIVELGGRTFPPGTYLERFDHEANGGLGFGAFTTDPAKALRFVDFAEAMQFWNKVPLSRPLRPDGKPNKPLSATSIAIEPVP